MPSLASARRRGSEVNVGPLQRLASLMGGTALVATALRRRSLGGVVAGVVGADLLYRAATGYCHVLGALGIDVSGRGGTRAHAVPAGSPKLQRSITVERARNDVYHRWRDPAWQPLVWAHFAELTGASEHGAHWRVDSPLGRTLECYTRIVEAREAELVRWQSTGDAPNEGSVEFRAAPGEYGTEVTLRVRFDPPAGRAGDAAARILDDPLELVLAKALRRFKSLVESGEISSTERNPSARAS